MSGGVRSSTNEVKILTNDFLKNNPKVLYKIEAVPAAFFTSYFNPPSLLAPTKKLLR